MSRSIARLGFTALALAAGSTVAFAQSSTTGSIYGMVTDEKGNPMVGATVRIMSAQVTRAEATGSNGAFRFGLLNPGNWKVTVTKAGFQTVNRDVSINTNTNQQANIKLSPVASTTVEVIATSVAAVDLTSAQTGFNVDIKSLETLPMGRDVNTIANFSPGVVDSGRLGGISISGASGLENQFIVDGLTSTDMRSGFQGAAMPSDFVDQVEVQTGAFKPEFSALGGVFNVITKSGSNTFAGSAWATTDARGSEAIAKRNAYFYDPAPKSRYDVGVGIGGAILKDKLFYYLGVASTTTSAEGVVNNQGYQNSKQDTDNLQIYAKLNYYPVQDHQFTFTVKNDVLNDKFPIRYQPNGDGNTLGRKLKNDVKNYGLNYDWTISSSLFLSVKYGQTKYSDSYTPTNDETQVRDGVWMTKLIPGFNPVTMLSPTFFRGGHSTYDKSSESTSQQIKADLSWFVGNHNLKFGISHTNSDFALVQDQMGPRVNPYYTVGGVPTLGPTALGYRVQIRYNAAVPGYFGGIDLTYFGNNAKVKAIYDAYYAQDTWEIMSGLRIFYGFRFEGQTLKNNKGETALQFTDFMDNLSPRLGFTWDVDNDGKTKVSGSFSRYYEAIPLQPVMRSGGAEQYVRNRYSAAQTTYDPITGAYSILPGQMSAPSITDFAGNFAAPPLEDSAKLPRRTEVTFGVDHTLANGMLVGMHGKYRKLDRILEDSVITDAAGNPLGDTAGSGYAILWNPHPGYVSWTGGPAATTPGAHYTAYQELYPEAFNIYQSVDFTLERKTSKYSINFSYTWSRLYGNYEGLGQSSNGQADANITSSFDYWPYVGYGLLPLDRTHVAKLFGSYNIDFKGDTLTVGFNASAQSGTPNNLFDDGATTEGNAPGSGSSLDIGGYGDAVPAYFQYGNYGRTDSIFNVDLKLEYMHKFGGVTIRPSFDMFNVFNTRHALTRQDLATDQNGLPDARYGAERSWQPGRRFRIGLKIQF
ncbi:MAG: TonB-dependent receptor [Holophaga sp.]|nr:TonB-dependent receptor [Holophaga sp.]